MLKLSSKLTFACLIVALSMSGLALARDHDDRGAQSTAAYGFQNGYADGFQQGREDRQAQVGYSLHSRDYDDALRGYEPYMGSRHRYRDSYRRGFRAGYDDGYHNRDDRFSEAYNQPPYRYRDDNHPGDRYGRRSVAFQVGYQDGLIAGGKDRRHHKGFRPSKHDRYEDASHGYNHEYGSKREYKREYRQGFLAGYQRGYGEY